MNKTGLTLATAHLATTHPPTDTGLRADPVDVGNAIRRALVKWIPDPAQRFLAAEDVHATLAATDPGPDQAWHHEADEGVVCAVCGEPWTCQGYVDQIEPDPGPDQADGGTA